jgi:hypothetical protein
MIVVIIPPRLGSPVGTYPLSEADNDDSPHKSVLGMIVNEGVDIGENPVTS